MIIPLEQRYEDEREMLRTFFDGRQADMWTSLPGIIVSFDPVAMTAVVQPAIRELYTGANLQQKFVNLPQCLDVPVAFPHGGGYTLTFPVQAGDECTLVFSSRCIDNWWDQGGIQDQFEKRMHDLSDAIAHLGPFSKATKIDNVSTTTTQMRTNDGTILTELDQPNKRARMVSGGLEVVLDSNTNTATVTAPTVTINASNQVNINTAELNMTATGGVNITTPLVNTMGAIQATGAITGNV